MPAGKMYKYRSGTKPGQSTRKIAKKALRIAKLGLGELGAHDVDIVAGTVGTTAIIARLSTMAQGDLDGSREGNEVLSKSVQFYGRMDASVNSTATILRLIVVKDRQNNGIPPTAAELLDTGADIDAFHPVFLSDIRNRFVTLYDKRWRLTFDADANTASSHGLIDFKVKLAGKQYFAGTTDADGSAGKNSIWSLIVSNEATNTPTVVLSSRYIFQDV